MEPSRFRKLLLAWYDAHKRDLPWRRTSDPYRIWVSEIMLQQTQVSTVIPYYERFLNRFPTAAALASAKEDDVVAAWAGLGYYRRARMLQAAAKVIVAEHGGTFPSDPSVKLPGIGRYTQGAILSIAFGRPLPVLDGNVARVLSRLYATPGEPKKNEARHWELAAELLDAGRPGDHNQAMMELGATVCTPAAPDCLLCPVAGLCRARALGRQDELPTPAARKAEVTIGLDCVLCRDGGRLLIEKRERGLLKGHWGLPEASEKLAVGERLGAVRHQITHHKVTLSLSYGSCRGRASAPLKWIAADRAGQYLVSSLWRKALALESSARAGRSGTPK